MENLTSSTMKFHQQTTRLPITDYTGINDDVSNRKNGLLLPNTVRCIIAGPSNSGKTNLMIALLTEKNGLRFSNVYVYGKSLNQPKYRLLNEIFNEVPEIGYFTYSESDNIITPQEAKPNSVFIFDDVSTEKQTTMRDFFCMGRHNNIDSFYLCQTYSKVPKQLIRDNANLLILFKQDELNLKHIYSDHVNTDMLFDEFKWLCSHCWSNKYGFLVIDKDSEFKRNCESARYRKGFDIFISI